MLNLNSIHIHSCSPQLVRNANFHGRGIHQLSTSRRLVKTRVGYRWDRGSGGRRKRESLLDNVDPAVPSDEEPLEEPETRPATTRGPEASSSGNENSQNGAGRSSAEPDKRSNNSGWEASSQNTDDNGWSAGPKPEADDWVWGFDRGRPVQPKGARNGSGGTWPGNHGASRVEDSAPQGTASAESDAREEARDGVWDEEDGPDIVELRPEEVALMLPAAPTAEQIQHCSGDSVVLWQRLGVSLLVTLATLKVSALAAGSLTFPLWYPSLQATLRNRSVRGKFRHVGLWRVAVVDVDVDVRTEPRFRPPRQRSPAGAELRALRLLVGDASGARSELNVPYQPRYDAIRVGELAEVLVLSRSRTFETFKALKEVYLPECGVWVSDYPYLNRDAFLDVSLEVERERQQEIAETL